MSQNDYANYLLSLYRKKKQEERSRTFIPEVSQGHLVVTVRAIIVTEGAKEVLLCQSRRGEGLKSDRLPQWGIPGGGRESGESVPHALLREIKEEVGEEVGIRLEEVPFDLLGAFSIERYDRRLGRFVKQEKLAAIFTASLPSAFLERNMQKGAELAALEICDRSFIEFSIKNDMFLHNHIRYWRAYCEWEKHHKK